MDLRVITSGRYRLLKDRAPGFIGQTLHKVQIVVSVAGTLGDLHEPFITPPEYAREIEDILGGRRDVENLCEN